MILCMDTTQLSQPQTKAPILRTEEHEIDELEIDGRIYTVRADLTYGHGSEPLILVREVVELCEDWSERDLDAEDRENLVVENVRLIRDALEAAAEGLHERCAIAREGW